MSNSAEWLPLKKFAKKFHHGKNAVRKLVQEGKLPPDKTRIDGVKLMIHESAEEEIRPLLHKGRPESDPELQPEEAIEYDGFTLTPDMIRRLEEVRQKQNSGENAR